MSKNICNKKPSSGKVETGFVNYSKSLGIVKLNSKKKKIC